MRTTFLFFAMLASIAASATVTVTPLGVDYATKKVTFRVSWTNSPAAPYNNRVWVWVDLCPITGTSPGTFAKAVISNPSATAGSIATVPDNTRGFYVTTNPSTVTAVLSNATGKFNWCVYGSDYPPNATMNNGTYALKGSSPFIVNNTTLGVGVNSFSGTCITALTDATGCPGIINNNFTPGSIATASYNGCINVPGTATTVATAPTGSGNYSYQWTVSYNNGTAATVSGATAVVYTPPATSTTGTYRYMRQVKDNLCSTAYTNSTGTITRTVLAHSAKDQTVNTCGCASGLTAVGSYCRNLTDDEASTYTGCGIEVKKNIQHSAYVSFTCPTGWRLPNETEVKCLYNNESKLGLAWGSSEHAVQFTNPTGTCNTTPSPCTTGGWSNKYVLAFNRSYCSGDYLTVNTCYQVCNACGGVSICIR